MRLLGRYPRTKLGILIGTVFAIVYLGGVIAWASLPRVPLSIGLDSPGPNSDAPVLVVVATQVLPTATAPPQATLVATQTPAPASPRPTAPIAPAQGSQVDAVLPSPTRQTENAPATPNATAPPPPSTSASLVVASPTPPPTSTQPLPTVTRVPPTPVPTRRPASTPVPITRTRGS